MSNLWPRAFARVFALALIHFPLAAQAQNDDEAIIVTATRFEENRLSAPIGMRFITSEQIKNSTAMTLPELLGELGGIQVRSLNGSPDLQLDMRGFGITGDDNTLVLIDGMRIEKVDQATRGLSSIPLQMVERIEILPGGGAVQYGGGASGGTINIITKKSKEGTRGLNVSAGSGTSDTSDLRAVASLGVGEFTANVGATRFESDNYRDNNHVQQGSVLGNMRWQRGEHSLALKLGADSQALRLPGPRNPQQLADDPRGTHTPFDRSHRDSGFATASAKTRAGEIDAIVDLGYREASADSAFFDSFGGQRVRNNDQWTKTLSPRLRWSASVWNMPMQFIGGADFYEWSYDAESPYVHPVFGSENDWESEESSRAVYGLWHADVFTSTRLTAGLRMQRIKTEKQNLTFNTEAEEKRTLYANEFGIRQSFAPRWAGFAKYARSFRIANVDENNSFVGTGDLLKPQTAKTKEIGVEYHSPKLRGSVVAFDMRLKNEISTALFPFPPNVFALNTNLTPTRKEGIELQVDWSATQALTVGSSLNYTKATFRSGVYNGVNVADKDIPLVPRWRGSINVSWKFWANTKLFAQYTYVGEQYYDNDQANLFEKIPAYELIDVRLSQELGSWLLAAQINNLFNERDYYSYGVVATNYSTFNAYPQAGRSFFFSAEYRFK